MLKQLSRDNLVDYYILDPRLVGVTRRFYGVGVVELEGRVQLDDDRTLQSDPMEDRLLGKSAGGSQVRLRPTGWWPNRQKAKSQCGDAH